MNSLVWVVMDSCRYDTFMRAATPTVDWFSGFNNVLVERRYSYASWTSPAHYAFMMGLVPHRNVAGVFASEVYKEDLGQWTERLGTGGLDFSKFIPHLSLPKVLQEMGYLTIGRVSLPVLNETTLLSAYFDDYRMMEDHNDFAGMIREMDFSGDRPRFYFFNLGETHYPYMLKESSLPRISGVHGAVRWLDREQESSGPMPFFDEGTMERLREQQVRCVEYIDGLLGELFRKCPKGTHVILTADHGELFGECNYFGHGPVIHEKVFEVPFVEGKVPKT
ncbi:MAG: sulfatase-like hydrolase/transferase [Planctomycetota bacterium]|nr:sulfatase-like hydrolase/transferase [Planctomycetota bacterium]